MLSYRREIALQGAL